MNNKPLLKLYKNAIIIINMKKILVTEVPDLLVMVFKPT